MQTEGVDTQLLAIMIKINDRSCNEDRECGYTIIGYTMQLIPTH